MTRYKAILLWSGTQTKFDRIWKKGVRVNQLWFGFFWGRSRQTPHRGPAVAGVQHIRKGLGLGLGVIQIVGDPHHTGSCPALVSELFKNRLSPLASKQASKQNEKSDFFVPAITPTPGGAPTRLGYGYILDIVRLHAHAYWRCPGLGCLGTKILNFEVQQNSQLSGFSWRPPQGVSSQGGQMLLPPICWGISSNHIIIGTWREDFVFRVDSNFFPFFSLPKVSFGRYPPQDREKKTSSPLSHNIFNR